MSYKHFTVATLTLFNICLAYSPRTGDVLFQNLNCGEICAAIAATTNNKAAIPIMHVAMLINKTEVIEASSNDVHLTKLQTFLQRSKNNTGRPLIIVGRLKPQYRKLIPSAVHTALSWQGRPYNYSFIYNNNFKSFYCSQLIYCAFMRAAKQPFFKLTHMSFKQAGRTLPAWKRYFKKLHKAIPEGELGTNPAMLAKSNKLKIIYNYVTAKDR